MILVHTKRPIRRDWQNHPHAKGLLLNADIRPGTSRLRAKLLVFDNCRNLHHFWRHGLGKGQLGRLCRGAVNGLHVEIQNFAKGQTENVWIEADPRYFCVIGLVRGYLSMEIICHESVHAAFNYVKRIRRSPWDAQADHFDEEKICYPAGVIAAEINKVLYKHDLFSK